jgi:hypothetical protein
MAAAGMCVFFEHARSRQPALGGSPRTDSGSAGNPDSPVTARKKSDAAVFCENRLENIRRFRDLRDELPTPTAE